MSLFEKINAIRNEPINFYNESVSNNLNNIVEILINKKNNNQIYQLSWSTRKEREIIKIFKNVKESTIQDRITNVKSHFKNDYEINVVYIKNNIKNKESNESMWNFFKEIQKMKNEKNEIFSKKIDYFIIYSIYEEQLSNTVKSKFNDNNVNNIVSFFFMFYYLQDPNNITFEVIK